MVVFSTTNTPFICKTALTNITGVTSHVFNYDTLYNLGYRSFITILQSQRSASYTLSFIYTNGTVNRVFINGNGSSLSLVVNSTTHTVTVSGLGSGQTHNVGIIVLN